MKKILTVLITFFLPSFLIVPLLKIMGYKVGKNIKIGFSFLFTNQIELKDNVRIGHLNLIMINSLLLDKNAIIGYLNVLKGPFSLILKEKAALGNNNYLTRGKIGVTFGESTLSLGVLTKITTKHHLDLTQSISFGDYSILAGIKSQLWTHGYYHANSGADRIRIDGKIIIGNNVYIGSGCIFNPGVEVVNSVHIGGGSVISKDLIKSGMYVNQSLRHIDNNLEVVKSKLVEVDDNNLVERVFFKK